MRISPYSLLFACTIALLPGCDAQAPGPEPGTAVVEIDGVAHDATATLSTTSLAGTPYQVARLVLQDGATFEILTGAFTEGTRTTGPPDPSILGSFTGPGHPPPYFSVARGTLAIARATASHVDGTFSFETYNPLASCTDCIAAEGPTLTGRFYATSPE